MKKINTIQITGDIKCHRCGAPQNCVCNAFIVCVYEEGYVVECFECRYADKINEVDKLKNTKETLYRLIRESLKKE